MGKGRKVGSIEVTVEEMAKIVELTHKGCNRKEIAESVGRCTDTVWRYQKKLNLL